MPAATANPLKAMYEVGPEVPILIDAEGFLVTIEGQEPGMMPDCWAHCEEGIFLVEYIFRKGRILLVRLAGDQDATTEVEFPTEYMARDTERRFWDATFS